MHDPSPILTAAAATPGQPLPTRFLARQPILDRDRQIHGYELLFRSSWTNTFTPGIANATEIMLDNYLLMGMESLSQNTLSFINCTRATIVERQVSILPPRLTVLELLETIEPDKELLNACRNLRSAGFKIALDDFVPSPAWEPFVRLADYIKIDFQQSNAEARREIRRLARGSRARFLAEKVETGEDFALAIDEGHEFFQGYFFCKPTVLAQNEIPPNRRDYLRLLVELSCDPVDLPAISRIVEGEPSLCFRLLRLTNSAMMGLRSEVTSIARALTVVGEARFRSLVAIAASTALGSDQPRSLSVLALERSRFCELLSPVLGENPAEQNMLGILSLVDAMLHIPMVEVVAMLPLRHAAKAALLGQSAPEDCVGIALNLARSFEKGDWSSCLSIARRLDVTEDFLAATYMESIRWASEALAAT